PDQVTDRYKIVVEAPAFQKNTKTTRLEAKNETDTVDFVLVPQGGIIFGKLTSSADEAITGARVELRRPFVDTTGVILAKIEETIDWVESGGDGAYSFGDLEPGTYRLRFSRTGYQGLVTDTFVVAYGDRILRDVQLSAAKGCIAVTAKNKDGKGISDVSVKSPQISSLIGFTDRDGKLLIVDAVADSVQLQFRALGYTDLDSTILVSANDTLAFNVTLAKSIGELLVRVVEKPDAQKRLQNIDVKLGDEDARTTDANGEVWFREAPAGKQKLRISPPKSETYAQDYIVVETEITIRPGPNPQPLTIELVPAARMSGTIKSKKDGGAVKGALVTLEGNTGVQSKSEADGKFELRNVPAGESIALLARKSGFKTARFKYDKALAAGDKITGLTIELEPSPMDSLFGFAVALDSITNASGGKNRAWGALIDIPPTFGVKLKDPAASLYFSNLEVDSAYRPVSDTVILKSTAIDVDVFGVDGEMKYDGGLHLEWIDSVKAGRIAGDVIVKDPISKIFPETKFIDFRIPKQYAPSFWAGGVNHGLERFGLTATATEVELKLKSVKIGLDYTKTNIDTAGLHLYGSLHLGSKLTLGFVEAKLEEHKLLADTELHEVEIGERFNIGHFDIETIRVNHSIPDGFGLALRLPCATIVHTGDFK
ncbi:MAG: carboxypeptidase regulatory-like domain-containing protein, partial [candidate division Zixibacteria bacterium]|nr:carboxypeptidase regulatory-like domain-containing protein [candidate division Zixibacteria bacterium]